MPKTIHTPRDELICGKIDHAFEVLQAIERGERGVVDLAVTLHAIRHDAERMEAKLAGRKAEAANLAAMREALRRVDHTLTVHGRIDAETPLHDLVNGLL